MNAVGDGPEARLIYSPGVLIETARGSDTPKVRPDSVATECDPFAGLRLSADALRAV